MSSIIRVGWNMSNTRNALEGATHAQIARDVLCCCPDIITSLPDSNRNYKIQGPLSSIQLHRLQDSHDKLEQVQEAHLQVGSRCPLFMGEPSQVRKRQCSMKLHTWLKTKIKKLRRTGSHLTYDRHIGTVIHFNRFQNLQLRMFGGTLL